MTNERTGEGEQGEGGTNGGASGRPLPPEVIGELHAALQRAAAEVLTRHGCALDVQVEAVPAMLRGATRVPLRDTVIGEPGAPRNRILVSRVVVEDGAPGGHDRVRIWNRGALAGELVVTAGDGVAVGERLAGAMLTTRGLVLDTLDAVIGLLDDEVHELAAASEVLADFDSAPIPDVTLRAHGLLARLSARQPRIDTIAIGVRSLAQRVADEAGLERKAGDRAAVLGAPPSEEHTRLLLAALVRKAGGEVVLDLDREIPASGDLTGVQDSLARTLTLRWTP